jgi:uncharacterized membrane protein
MKAKSVAAARIWVNMIAESTESSNVAVLEHKNNTCIFYFHILLSLES